MAYCNWGNTSALNIKYHDEEWGVPVHDDRKQFEFLMLEVLQCGLSWNIIINKREIFRRCFNNFDYDKIAFYGEKDVARIMSADGMIKSERKIRAIIHNAQCFRKIRDEYGCFSDYLWAYTDGKTICYNKHGAGEIPAANGLSDMISKDLKKRGFKFLGSVTVYAYLQAAGMINDHGSDCPRYKYICEHYPTIVKPRFQEHNVQYFES